MDPVLKYFNPIHTLIDPCKTDYNIFLPFMLACLKMITSLPYISDLLMKIFISHVYFMPCLSNTTAVLGKEYKLCCSSSCNLLHPLILSIFFSDILRMRE